MWWIALACTLAFGLDVVEERKTEGVHGYAVVDKSDGESHLFVSGVRGESFVCGEGNQGVRQWSYKLYAARLSEVAAAAKEGVKLKGEPAKNGLKAYTADTASACNLTVSSDGLEIWAAFVHTRACFGSAGCNKEIGMIVLTPEQAKKLAADLLWAIEK